MWPLLVVPLHPGGHRPSGVLKPGEMILPHTFFLQTAKEPFNEPILFRGIQRHELLLEAIVPKRPSKPATLIDQAIVTPQHRRDAGWRGSRIK